MPSQARRTPHPTTAVQDVPDLRDWPFEPALNEGGAISCSARIRTGLNVPKDSARRIAAL